jgi:hypothetical protein
MRDKKCFKTLNIDSKDWIMIAAIIMGPILAVQAQRIVEIFREKRSRRMNIFKTLMSTRAERLHRDHIQSLNMIDIEFYGKNIFGKRIQSKKEKAVTDAWKSYNAHLGEKNKYDTLDSWLKRGDELFTKLLFEISIALGYDFDEVQLKLNCYRPEAHNFIENIYFEILTGLEKILKGERSLPMEVTSFPNMTSPEEIEAEKTSVDNKLGL